MDRDKIIQMAMDCDSMMVLEIREMDAKDEFLLEFAAAIRAATKEEDARIVEPSADHRNNPNDYLGGEEGLELLENVAAAIRASK